MADVSLSIDGAVATVWMNDPPVNAQTIERMKAIIRALKAAGDDRSVRAVVLASRLPRAFCAGLDLVELQTLGPKEIRELVELIYVDLWNVQAELGKPSIAAVCGAARGGGITLAMSCNMIVAGTSATFGYPEINAGLVPGIHFSHLPRLVGRYQAFEMLFAPEDFDAETAKRVGLVNRVVPDADLLTEAQNLARVVASKPPQALERAHKEFMRVANERMDEHRRAVEVVCEQLGTDESRNLIRSFTQRRPKN